MLLRRTEVYEMLHCFIIFKIFCRLEEKRGQGVGNKLPNLIFTFHHIHGIFPFTQPTSTVHFFENFARLSYLLWIIPIPQNLIFLFYFESKGRIFLAHLATDFLHEMKTATWDNFRFFILMERCFYLLLCNLFHKAAFMNFMFPEHCHITLLGPKCKTSLVITLNIQYLGKTFLQ